MTITRKLPPIVDVSRASVRFTPSAVSASVPREAVETFAAKTRSLLLKDRERAIRLDDANPDYTLTCKITGFELVERRRSEKIGNDTKSYLLIIGNIEAAIEVLDKTLQAVDSAILKSHFEREYPEDAGGLPSSIPGLGKKSVRIPTQLERYSFVMEGLATKVAQRLVPVEDEVQIQLPKGGKFRELRALARSNRWGELRAAASNMPKFKDSEDDSYRLYMLALSYEGLAYEEARKDTAKAKDLLTEAYTQFSEAKKLKSKEGYYIVPEIRSQESLDAYLELERVQTLAKSRGATSRDISRQAPAPTPTAPPPAPAPAAAPAPQHTEFNNAFLIDMKKQGKDDDLLLTLVQTADPPKFDVSPKGIMELTVAGVSSPVLKAVMAKMKPAAVKPLRQQTARPPVGGAAPGASAVPPAPANKKTPQL